MAKKEFSFKVISHYKKARLGKIKTSRGDIDTPAFMPVGTLGTVKGVFVDDLLKTGSKGLSNLLLPLAGQIFVGSMLYATNHT